MRFPEFDGEWSFGKLKDIAILSKGSGISKDQLSDYGKPCILYGELYTKYKSEIIKEVVSKTNIDNSGLVQSKANDVIIPCSGEAAIEIATARCVQMDNILLGGDLNVIRLKGHDGGYFAYQLNGKRKIDIAKVAQGVSVVHLYGEHLKRVKVAYPSLREQQKISSFLSLLDERISTQIKIIEDLKKLKSAITHSHFNSTLSKYQSYNIGECITQVSKRNKDRRVSQVLSVSNKSGFINQSEQFEDREIASEDTTNYKVVNTNDFAYNPARINVGSIARLHTFSSGIVSPMYVCFHTNLHLLAEYFEHYFYTKHFKNEMYKRLEGSVRLCLTYESLCNIKIALPTIEEQETFIQKINIIVGKIGNEKRMLSMYQFQKRYILAQMFI